MITLTLIVIMSATSECVRQCAKMFHDLFRNFAVVAPYIASGLADVDSYKDGCLPNVFDASRMPSMLLECPRCFLNALELVE